MTIVFIRLNRYLHRHLIVLEVQFELDQGDDQIDSLSKLHFD